VGMPKSHPPWRWVKAMDDRNKKICEIYLKEGLGAKALAERFGVGIELRRAER
jgi:hypothetical protein